MQNATVARLTEDQWHKAYQVLKNTWHKPRTEVDRCLRAAGVVVEAQDGVVVCSFPSAVTRTTERLHQCIARVLLQQETPFGEAKEEKKSAPEPKQAPVGRELVPFRLADDRSIDIPASQIEQDVWVEVATICGHLGIAPQDQIDKIKSRTRWRSRFVLGRGPNDASPQDRFCVHVDALALWLNSIEPSRVRQEVRPALKRIQDYVADVVQDHFFGARTGRSPNDPVLLQVLQLLQRQMAQQDETSKHIAAMVAHNTQTTAALAERLGDAVRRQEETEEKLRHTVREIDTQEEQSGTVFATAMQRKYGRYGRLGEHSTLSYQRLSVNNLCLLVARAGIPRKDVTVLHENREKRLLLKPEARAIVEPYIAAWFKYGTPNFESTRKARVGTDMKSVGYDYRPDSLRKCLEALGKYALTPSALDAQMRTAYRNPPAKYPHPKARYSPLGDVPAGFFRKPT